MEIEYAIYEKKYCDDMLKLAILGFGEGYLSEKKLDTFNFNDMFYVALLKGKVIGYCFFIEETLKKAQKDLKVDAKILNEYNNGNSPICLTKSMAIDEKFKGQGIGRKLFELCYKKCVKNGYKSAWGSAWKIGENVLMKKIFSEFQFESIGEVADIWYEDEDYNCIVCGGRCHCNGVIFVKTF